LHRAGWNEKKRLGGSDRLRRRRPALTQSRSRLKFPLKNPAKKPSAVRLLAADSANPPLALAGLRRLTSGAAPHTEREVWSPARQKRRRALLSAVVLAGALMPACRRSQQREPGDAGPKEIGRACASACAALVTAGCGLPGLSEADQPRCVDSCLKTAALAQKAGCLELHAAHLACVSTAQPDCARLRCSAGTCLQQGTGIAGCADRHGRLTQCLAPCASAGITQVFNRDVEGRPVQLEVVRGGCAECPKQTRPGAPAGAPCSSHSVCAEHCCNCTGRVVHYLARACVAGRCAGREAACELRVPEAALCR
jgi:hypothetical protein